MPAPAWPICSMPATPRATVWADSGYRSRRNENLLRQRMLISHIHRKKPQGIAPCQSAPRGPMRRSRRCAPRIEHVFAEQKAPDGAVRAHHRPPLGPRPRSASPTWSPTCAACSGLSATRRSPDPGGGRPTPQAAAICPARHLTGADQHRSRPNSARQPVNGGVQFLKSPGFSKKKRSQDLLRRDAKRQ